jgi:serine/threonine protein kinase
MGGAAGDYGSTAQWVAVKFVTAPLVLPGMSTTQATRLREYAERAFQREIKALKTLEHASAYTLKLLCVGKRHKIIVTPFQAHQSLDALRQQVKLPMDFKLITLLFVAQGVCDMHAQNCTWLVCLVGLTHALTHSHMPILSDIHRDIRMANVFVGENFRPFLGDFGLAKQKFDMNNTSWNRGHTFYQAPEFVPPLPYVPSPAHLLITNPMHGSHVDCITRKVGLRHYPMSIRLAC